MLGISPKLNKSISRRNRTMHIMLCAQHQGRHDSTNLRNNPTITKLRKILLLTLWSYFSITLDLCTPPRYLIVKFLKCDSAFYDQHSSYKSSMRWEICFVWLEFNGTGPVFMILYEISAIKILPGIVLIKYSENSGNKVNKHKYTVDAGRSS